mmetsp:Transcript_16532/g.25001  ORF Transcript_16532/g.25001 Transcript_16532/m.25001 type:complete len:85 (-) Transcript_16532:2356-2610(-)
MKCLFDGLCSDYLNSLKPAVDAALKLSAGLHKTNVQHEDLSPPYSLARLHAMYFAFLQKDQDDSVRILVDFQQNKQLQHLLMQQ